MSSTTARSISIGAAGALTMAKAIKKITWGCLARREDTFIGALAPFERKHRPCLPS